MKKKISNFKFQISNYVKHPLFSGSAVMIVGTNFANFLAYLYHLVLARMLGPSAYSELAAALAALSLFSTAFVFLGMVVVKFVSSAKNEEKGILYKWLTQKSLKLGIVMVVILGLASPLISNFLRLPLKTSILVGPTLFFFLLSFLFRSFLQGLLKFGSTVLLTIVDIGSRLILGMTFVYLGFSAFGATFAIFLGAFFSSMMGLYLLREFRLDKTKKEFKDSKKVLKYALPIIIVSIANNSFISSDVILAKHYFIPHIAGIYASLSTLGKIIFYGTAPVASVMFPMISKRYSEGKNYQKILMLSLIITAGLAFSVLGLYAFFPVLMVKVLFGSGFLEAASNLVWFGLFMTFYTLANVLISFYLSIERTRIVAFPVIFALFQVVGIIFYHGSIINIIQISTLSALFLLISLLIYFYYDKRRNYAKL